MFIFLEGCSSSKANNSYLHVDIMMFFRYVRLNFVIVDIKIPIRIIGESIKDCRSFLQGGLWRRPLIFNALHS